MSASAVVTKRPIVPELPPNSFANTNHVVSYRQNRSLRAQPRRLA
jgi:hypothetical protein